jgi:predicted nucleic acid-binding protein
MLIDTNILIYAIQPGHAHIRSFILNEFPSISVISKVEAFGYHQLDSEQEDALQEIFSQLNMIYLSPASYEIAIELKKRKKLSLPDACIAATCIEHKLTLVTHNVKDYV